MRAFLAIELPDEAKGEILRVSDMLRKSNLLQGKFVEIDNLHLTLKFFGEIIEKEAKMIYDVLRQIEFQAFKCKLGKLGFFGSRILWIDIIDNGSIKKLHDIIDDKLGDFFSKDERFHNHMTIARIKQIKDKTKLIEFTEKLRINPIEFSVDEFKFMKSELTPQGPVYKELYGFKLK
ncbi:RNA 2',3'-cyclic phosphodiesterase [Candidatus Pacearchaeota archaeon]|nr:RNA 2',3'-cyclic phosphodiesterase [Candidatus Pacearchaeota archaeon]